MPDTTASTAAVADPCHSVGVKSPYRSTGGCGRRPHSASRACSSNLVDFIYQEPPPMASSIREALETAANTAGIPAPPSTGYIMPPHIRTSLARRARRTAAWTRAGALRYKRWDLYCRALAEHELIGIEASRDGWADPSTKWINRYHELRASTAYALGHLSEAIDHLHLLTGAPKDELMDRLETASSTTRSDT